MLRPADRRNFETLCKAFDEGNVALMECRDAKTGEYRAVICAVEWEDGGANFVPFAILPHENPYDLVVPAVDERNAA